VQIFQRARGQDVLFQPLFQLVAANEPPATKPYNGGQDITKSSASQKYLKKLSAPFLDQSTCMWKVPPFASNVLVNAQRRGECSASIPFARLKAVAQATSTPRWYKMPLLSGRQVRSICALSDDDNIFMQQER